MTSAVGLGALIAKTQMTDKFLIVKVDFDTRDYK